MNEEEKKIIQLLQMLDELYQTYHEIQSGRGKLIENFSLPIVYNKIMASIKNKSMVGRLHKFATKFQK